MLLQRWLRGFGGSLAAISRSILPLALLTCLSLCSQSYSAVILLNDTWADGDRTNVNLPTDSPTYIGQSAGNGSNSVTPGSLNFVLPTNSLKVWTYFTSDHSAPDGNQPHNAVTQLGVGGMLTAEWKFKLPGGASTIAGTGKNYRFGLFWDPTDPRTQLDVNSDGGGGTAPWTDAVGYAVQFPIHGTSSGANPLQVGKRTTSNSSLIGSAGAYTFAPTGGATYAMTSTTEEYTVQLMLNVVSSTQLDVSATLKQGNTVLSTLTASDTGTAFGGTAIGAGLLPGSQSIYTNFDHMMFRSSNTEQVFPPPNGEFQFTNLHVELKIPEPATMVLVGLGGLALVSAIRRRSY